MCGIAGTFGSRLVEPTAAERGRRLVEEMTRRLAHRGPDGHGVASRGRGVLGHALLSLLDRAHGEQPMPAARWLLAYNGEIYDAHDHRRRLEAEGVAFAGRCDTEVLLRRLERDGLSACDGIEGMYAFAATDGERLWLGRDAFGVKPLLYAVVEGGKRIVFASELKAILADPAVARRIDRRALVEQATFGHPLAGRTLIHGVQDVPPSTVLEVTPDSAGQLVLTMHRHSRAARVDLPTDREAAADLVAERLRASVARQRIADHPVGAYLSGGLDSAMLVALLNRPSPGGAPTERIHTFATADRRDHPDLQWARQIAERLGTRHHEAIPTRRDLLVALPSTVVGLESTAPPSIAEAGARVLRPHVKAALSGDGADELFAGYVMHARPEAWLRTRAQRFNRVVQVGRLRGGGPSEEDAAPTLEHLGQLRAAAVRGPEALRRATYAWFLADQLSCGHLRRWDLGTMSRGLELRVPYLDRSLRDLAAALPGAWRVGKRTPDGPEQTKLLLRLAARRILPLDLVEAITRRRKLAAPSAYADSRRGIERFARRLLPSDRLAAPGAPFVGRATERLLLDLFLLAFIDGGGSLPLGFRLADLYGVHRPALDRATEAAFG